MPEGLLVLSASDCLVCSGPLHDSWLGSAVAVLAVTYVSALAVVLFTIDLIKPDVQLRGAFWRAVPVPLEWAWIGVRFVVTALLPPERRPRRTRTELERRIADLEHELEIGR